MSLDIKDLQEKYNLFDTDGKLIVANLIKCLNFVYSHLGDSIKANDHGDLEVGRNLEVDGNATINSELELGESGDIGANLSNAIATALQGHFTKLYKHTINTGISGGDNDYIVIYNNDDTPITTKGALLYLLRDDYSTMTIKGFSGQVGIGGYIYFAYDLGKVYISYLYDSTTPRYAELTINDTFTDTVELYH